MNEKLENRLHNYKFNQALQYLKNENKETKNLIKALAKIYGNCGWFDEESIIAKFIDHSLINIGICNREGWKIEKIINKEIKYSLQNYDFNSANNLVKNTLEIPKRARELIQVLNNLFGDCWFPDESLIDELIRNSIAGIGGWE